MKSKNPVALDTIPVSRSPGQYLTQIIEAAAFPPIMAITRNAMFKNGAFVTKRRAKKMTETQNITKTVAFMLWPSLSYTKTLMKVENEIINVVTV